jgi:hypothetical protein
MSETVSSQDRMVSIYRPTDNPIWRDGMELVATVTVSTDDDGEISIGVAHSPSDSHVIKVIDDEKPPHSEE